ncbi:MAG: hypothetical protein IPG45_11590 [Deltaproteobacteria bacterium]|jgi:hypothetical protein|nr:hypothetical protein [Deltaproteobacteria bacterium]
MRALIPLLLAATLWPVPASAFPVHRRLFQTQYPGSVRCELCHKSGGGSGRNEYGLAWQKAGETVSAFAAIDSLDSDGDGATNRAEIDAASNPGDPNSTPKSPGARYRRPQTVPIPTEQLLLVFPRVSGMEAMEATLDEAQAKAIEKGWGRKLSDEDRLPTLYFATEANQRVAVANFVDVVARNQHFTLLVGVNTDGSVRALALLRAGADEPELYRPYLDCLKGAKLGQVPTAGKGGCPNLSGRTEETKALSAGVDLTLRTMQALFKKGG